MSTNEKVTTAAADATDTVDAEKKTDESTEAIKTEGPSSKDDAEGEADKKTEGDEEADNSNVKADETSDNKNNNKKRDAREMEPDDDDAAADGVGSSVGKRRKKTTAVFVPDNFHEKKEVETTKGRGKKLKAIPSTRKSIEEYKTTSEAFQAGYRLLFPGRGRLPLSAKDELLDFDGYLPEVDKDADQAKIDKQEEALETKYSKRAYKLTTPALKMICDFFDVDRSGSAEEKVNKDVLVDRLLDFLSAPDEKLTKTSGKRPKSASKKKATDDDDNDEDEEEEEEEEEEAEEEEEENTSEEKGKSKVLKGKLGTKAKKLKLKPDDKIPNDKVLRKWVRAYIACHNMKNATLRHAIELATEKFEVDMKPKKGTIKMFIMEES